MDDSCCVSYESAGMLAQLTRDYLAGKAELENLYSYQPNLKAFQEAIEDRAKYPVERDVLVKAIQKQYEGIKLPKPVKKNLNALQQESTFTIVTGHQLCLFTGPLYFVYKILSTINLARQLKEAYPEHNFVPVYWMATEDHDFDEINHTWIGERKWQWTPTIQQNESGHYGKVGAIPTNSLDSLIDELKVALGDSDQARRIIELLSKSYLEQDNLSAATRFLVNELFGKDGVVCVDGDDVQLKQQFAPVVQKELLSNMAFSATKETIDNLSKDYKIQVNPREINLFYMKENLRERIEKNGDKFEIVNTSLSFSEAEMLGELEKHPERFSPNVMLRPVYQEVILPNLAYIGGGAEVAYWLELKKVFERAEVFYPMLLLRNSALTLAQKTMKKIDQVGLELLDVFRPENELVQQLVKEDVDERLEFTAEEKEIQSVYKNIEERMKKADQTLEYSVRSALEYQLKYLRSLEKKLFRAEKKKRQVVLDRIAAIKKAAYPIGGLQERTINIIQMWLEYGDNYIAEIGEQFDPLRFELVVFVPGEYEQVEVKMS